DDHEDVQAAPDEALRREQADDQARLGGAGDGARSFQDAEIRVSGLDSAFDADEGEERGRREEGRGRGGEDDSGVREGDEGAGEEWAAEGADALDRGGRAVGGDQLLGSRRERRQDRLEGGAEQGGADADDGGEREDRGLVLAGEVGEGGRGEGDGSDEGDREQVALAVEAVAEAA